tara:strand:+ start:598 stop:882 length:285 start_codon:yes stop_codon:yes gene_type:complete
MGEHHEDGFSPSLALVPVCSEARLRLAALPAEKAERLEEAEGKITETGTVRRQFQGKPLFVYCFSAALAAPSFLESACLAMAQSLGFAGIRSAP